MDQTYFTACIVAAGRGERAGGGVPKQFRRLADKSVLAHSAEAFARHPDCKEIVIAVAPGQRDEAVTALGDLSEAVRIVEGGADRSASVRAAASAATRPFILIHDAARPLVSQAVIDAVLSGLKTYDGVAPALPVADALAREADGGIEPVDRSGLWRMQTPQGFHQRAFFMAITQTEGRSFPDEIAMARAAGVKVGLAPGDEANFKLTWPADFARAERLLAAETNGSTAMTVTGMGYDVHRLESGDGMHLCGVHIAGPLALVGHSDADAGLHAITDALLGAAGLGDIGDHFPPTDERWRGADSAMFLQHAVKISSQAGARLIHCDVTLICERPKIGPHKAAMKARVADILGLSPERVNIKATTTEKLGFTGRGEGLAAEAVVSCVIDGITP
jgi:2-C-methyl-D-erythritol 4-phosphate cytidylyltransferase/2-C-methyl-D-erythritol 2,4-cyclodiphosphate synthase